MNTQVLSPMAGKIIEVKVKVGDKVDEDDEMFILEAVKMEMPIVAPASGVVKEINASAGQAVEGEFVLALLE